MKNKELTSLLSGISGEYYVAAELSYRGYIASITLRNTRGIDILASNSEAKKVIGIQVKTNKIGKRSWILNNKAEKYYGSNLFYVFVSLRGLNQRPDFHIVPSNAVAKHVEDGHKKWLSTPGKKGQKHIDTTMRKFNDQDGKYLEKWELLGL